MVYILLNVTDSEIWFVSGDWDKAERKFQEAKKENPWGTFRLEKYKF